MTVMPLRSEFQADQMQEEHVRHWRQSEIVEMLKAARQSETRARVALDPYIRSINKMAANYAAQKADYYAGMEAFAMGVSGERYPNAESWQQGWADAREIAYEARKQLASVRLDQEFESRRRRAIELRRKLAA